MVGVFVSFVFPRFSMVGSGMVPLSFSRVSLYFSELFSGWGMFTPLLFDDLEWWGVCFLCVAKVFYGRVGYGSPSFPLIPLDF